MKQCIKNGDLGVAFFYFALLNINQFGVNDSGLSMGLSMSSVWKP